MSAEPSKSTQRIDKWLWHARFARTRSMAQKLIKGGNVRIDRRKVSSNSQTVCRENVLTITLPREVKVVRILGLSERRSSFPQAQLLYEDLTEPVPKARKAEPTKEDLMRRGMIKGARPDKQSRRIAIRMKKNFINQRD
ncbi:MAG: RNA-binding S4 domain-containing protein [Pseudomonadota bacterium]